MNTVIGFDSSRTTISRGEMQRNPNVTRKREERLHHQTARHNLRVSVKCYLSTLNKSTAVKWTSYKVHLIVIMKLRDNNNGELSAVVQDYIK